MPNFDNQNETVKTSEKYDLRYTLIDSAKGIFGLLFVCLLFVLLTQFSQNIEITQFKIEEFLLQAGMWTLVLICLFFRSLKWLFIIGGGIYIAYIIQLVVKALEKYTSEK